MRTLSIVVMALLGSLGTAGCKKQDGPAGQASTRSLKDADALWAVAPANLIVGLVVTPRGLTLLEGGLSSLQTLLQQAPELAAIKNQLDQGIEERLGRPFTNLADLGLDRTKGAALFVTEEGPSVVVPLGDREKLRAAFELGPDAGQDRLGPAYCKTIQNVYACAKTEAGLASLGKGQLPAQVQAIGARGDLELVVTGGSPTVAIVGQLERGTVVIRGDAEAPPQLSSQLGAPVKPRTDGDKTSAFGVANLGGVLGMLPDVPLMPGLSLAELGKVVSGPITVTIAPGTTTPDVRVPVSDPAPVTKLVEGCAAIVPPPMLAPQQKPGACSIVIAEYGMAMDLWVEGNELRVGAKGDAPATKQVAMTALGAELAGTPWSLGFWGRGTMFGAAGFGNMPETLPSEVGMMFRALSLINELGVAVKLDGGKASFVVGLRSLWANPPDTVTKLLAIPADDLARGKSDTAAAIAKNAPGSPFAADFASGQGGLMVPTAVVGVLASVAVPAFMQYMKRSKQAEADLVR